MGVYVSDELVNSTETTITLCVNYLEFELKLEKNKKKSVIVLIFLFSKPISTPFCLDTFIEVYFLPEIKTILTNIDG